MQWRTIGRKNLDMVPICQCVRIYAVSSTFPMLLSFPSPFRYTHAVPVDAEKTWKLTSPFATTSDDLCDPTSSVTSDDIRCLQSCDYMCNCPAVTPSHFLLQLQEAEVICLYCPLQDLFFVVNHARSPLHPWPWQQHPETKTNHTQGSVISLLLHQVLQNVLSV